MGEIKYSQSYDVAPDIIKDVMPEKCVKVFPYEFVDTLISEAFVKENSVTIAHISQEKLLDPKQQLKEDENGNKYFEMFLDVTFDTKLDIASTTSVFGQELKEEVNISGLSNWSYKSKLSNIMMGKFSFLPALFSIGEPYDQSKYQSGEQGVFIPTSIFETLEAAGDYGSDINPEGLYEFTLANLTAIENTFTNVRIIPTLEQYNSPSFVNGKTIPKITLEGNKSTLFNHVKLRASYIKSPEKESVTDMIDLYSANKIAPIMLSPTSVGENIEMYADWFNYDNAMPWYYAQNFSSGKGTLQSIGLTTDETDLIGSMLQLTAAFADSFNKAPRIGGDTANSDKIHPLAKVGGKVITAIEGKDPVKVIDGLYEEFIRSNPDFLEDRQRVQRVNMVIAALSRYINSSYAIGKGVNSFNTIYLPWFLEPAIEIDYGPFTPTYKTPAKEELNGFQNFGTTGYIFQFKTNYFKTNFSDKTDFEFGTNFSLPDQVNLSSQVLLRSDRPVALPQVEDTISEINKLPLAGDIDTKSNTDLKNLYYMQISNIADIQKLYVNETKAYTVPGKNQYHTVPSFKMNTGAVNKITQQDIKDHILKGYPGWDLVTDTVNSKAEPKVGTNHMEYSTVTSVETLANYGSTGDNYRIYYRWPDGSTGTSGNRNGAKVGSSWSSRVAYVTYTYYWTIPQTQIVKVSAGDVKSYSLDRRQIIFNKQEWKSFITDNAFNMNPNGLELTFNSDNIIITQLKELIIGSIWADYMILRIGTSKPIQVPMFNKDDETIGIQRIIFT